MPQPRVHQVRDQPRTSCAHSAWLRGRSWAWLAGYRDAIPEVASHSYEQACRLGDVALRAEFSC